MSISNVLDMLTLVLP